MTPQEPPISPKPGSGRVTVISLLGVTQLIAYGSSFYLVGILGDPMAREIGVSSTNLFAAFSVALLISAALGPRVGRIIDRFGGREVLVASNVMFAAALIVLAVAQSAIVMWAGWLVMGIAMALGLYEAAFAALGRMYGETARRAITGITLIAGFASTVGWPLTAWMEAEWGWRTACMVWAGAHLALSVPLHLVALPKLRASTDAPQEAATGTVTLDRTVWLLAFAFAAGWIVAIAMAAHLPRVLEAAGATTTQAVAAAALLGPAQVAGRMVEAVFLQRHHPLHSARFSTLAHPVGAGLIVAGGGLAAMPFAVLHGVGTGIFTIARGTVPLAIFGPRHYGYRLGLLSAPARLGQAAAPLAFAVLFARYGTDALIATAALSLAAWVALMVVRADTHTSAAVNS